MAQDIQGKALRLASRFAGSKWAEKYGLRKPAERFAYFSTRTGFRLIGKFLQKKTATPSSTAPDQAPAAETPELQPTPSAKNLFDLSLSDEQLMIQDSVRAYAAEVIKGLAHDADDAKALPDQFLEDSMALGLNLFAVPESLGGAAQDYSPTTSAIIAEELGRGDFTLATAILAPVAVANALVRWGNKAQQERWLPLWLADKPVRACIAVQEAHPLFDPYKLQTVAKKTSRGYEICGSKTLVPLGGQAQLYLIAAMLNGKPKLFILPADSAGLSFEASPAMGLRAAETGTLTLHDVQVGSDALLGGGDHPFNYAEFVQLGQLHWCALAIGTCQAALDYSITYANERIAFGEPISHRQSVAFMIANMAIEIDAMRLLTWRAAALAESGKKFEREAYLAQLLCTEKAMEIGTNAVQILGGHGFTKEHPAERWYRDLCILGCITSGLHL